MQPVALGRVLWPLMAEIVLGFCVGLVGLWLASKQGDSAAAGFALSNQVITAAALLFRVVNMGASVVITQAKGAGNPTLARALALASLGASTRVGLVVALALGLAAPGLLVGLGASHEVQAAGTPLLWWLAAALVLDGYCAAMGSALRANLLGAQALKASICMHASHLLLCWPLMAQWGVVGFGIAMLLSRALTIAIHLALWRSALDIRPARSDWWTWHKHLLRNALLIGLPGAAETIAYRVAALFVVSVVAGLGTAHLAAHSYVLQLVNAVVLATVALGFACEIVVGHCVGAGQFAQARSLVRRALWLGLMLSGLAAIVNAILAPLTLTGFTQSAQVISLAAPAMWIAVALEPGRCCNVVLINALRGAGDAKFPVVVGSVSMLLVMAGGAWVLGRWLGWGLAGVWIALAADELLRGALMWWRWESLSWVRSARLLRTEAKQRLSRAST